MEGHCSTGQRPQRAVPPMEEEEEEEQQQQQQQQQQQEQEEVVLYESTIKITTNSIIAVSKTYKPT
jgi:hypothetical protein